MHLDVEAAVAALARDVAAPLGLELADAAEAVLRLATERMARAIEDMTLEQGIDPRHSTIVSGGGAAGFNIVAIARSLGCARVIVPEVTSALSAAGALLSDLSAEFSVTAPTSTSEFDFDAANAVMDDLVRRCQRFIDGPGAGSAASQIEIRAEARYPHQVWELEVPVPVGRFSTTDDVDRLRRDFDAQHLEVFQINDPGSPVEIVGWQASAHCRLAREDAVVALPPRAELPPSVAVISGEDPRAEDRSFINQIILAWTGGPAGPDADGWLTAGGVGDGGALRHDSIELDELHFPVVFYEQRLLADTEGAGRTRGAPAARLEYGPRSSPLDVAYGSDGSECAPEGARGGLPGAKAEQFIRTADGTLAPAPAFALVRLQAGDRMVSICCGGGGYGPPEERDPRTGGGRCPGRHRHPHARTRGLPRCGPGGRKR